MATIKDLYEAFGAVRLREDLPEIIQGTSKEIEILVKSQLSNGELSTGEKISKPYASTYYANKKHNLNPSPGYGIPDVKLTGALYDGISVTVTTDEYDIESSVDYSKADSITQYGPQLLAMSEESKQIYCDDTLLPAIQNYITERTGLTFE